jgi:signal transduction histidine kinase
MSTEPLELTRLELMGSAAAGIAHDINNQLHLIVNHLSTVDHRASPDVESALQAVQRCSALTSSLLSYCRGEPIEIRSLDPVDFLRKFIPQLRLPAGIALLIEVPETLPPIAADPTALSRVLGNLISNAVAAMSGGKHAEGILRIAASRQAIEIGDSGPGVPPEMDRIIFEPFFSTKGAQGTGLGLSIVRDIMRQHGGSVTLRSKPGKGANFALRFRAG